MEKRAGAGVAAGILEGAGIDSEVIGPRGAGEGGEAIDLVGGGVDLRNGDAAAAEIRAAIEGQNQWRCS